MIDRKKAIDKEIKLGITNLNEKDYQKFLEFIKFQEIYEKLKGQKSTESLLKQLQEEILIPIPIFNKELSALESICKYLKENLELSNKKISLLLNKSSKSIWQAYTHSKSKFPSKFEVKLSKYSVPISIFKQRKSVLESLVTYLRESFTLSYHEIALLLERDDRTIWTVYQRARRKYEK